MNAARPPHRQSGATSAASPAPAVKTAFVLSGGGSLGAIQVGMLRALTERGVVPDLLIGTSVGALNAASVAAHGVTSMGVDTLAEVWAGLKSRQVFALELPQVLAAVAGRRDALCSDKGLVKLLDEHLSFKLIEEAPIPLVIVAADILTGQEVPMSTGPAKEAILASSAIPGVFPTVTIEGRTLTDGGLANNTAISQALASGAETIYVLPSGYSCSLSAPPTTALGVATQAIALLIHQRLVDDIARFSAVADLIVLPPPCPIHVQPTDFSHSGELMALAHEAALRALAIEDGRRAEPHTHVAMHVHPPRLRGGRKSAASGGALTR